MFCDKKNVLSFASGVGTGTSVDKLKYKNFKPMIFIFEVAWLFRNAPFLSKKLKSISFYSYVHLFGDKRIN